MRRTKKYFLVPDFWNSEKSRMKNDMNEHDDFWPDFGRFSLFEQDINLFQSPNRLSAPEKRNLQARLFDGVIPGRPELYYVWSYGLWTFVSLVKDSIITCDPNALTLQVPKCAFESINFDWSKAYLAGPDKTPQLDGNDLNPCTGVENGNEIVFRNCDPNKINWNSYESIIWRRNISFWTEMDHFKAFSMILNPVVQMFSTMAHISSTLMPYKDLLECQTLSFPVHVMSRYARNITRICRPTTCVNIISSSIMNVHSRIHSFSHMDLQLILSCQLSM